MWRPNPYGIVCTHFMEAVSHMFPRGNIIFRLIILRAPWITIWIIHLMAKTQEERRTEILCIFCPFINISVKFSVGNCLQTVFVLIYIVRLYSIKLGSKSSSHGSQVINGTEPRSYIACARKTGNTSFLLLPHAVYKDITGSCVLIAFSSVIMLS